MSKIESIKSYSGQQLDTIFFRPMLTGSNAEQLGIKVMYNMPVPTTLHFWKRDGNILRRYSSSGWTGGVPADKYQKQIKLHKVKAEVGYSADNYFSTVYELITGRADVNLDDLSGTELEQAETSLFRASIAESVRATMWYGNTERSGELNTFDGFVKQIVTDSEDEEIRHFAYIPDGEKGWAEALLKRLWDNSTEELRALRSEGQLAFFVTTDVYNAYEEELDSVAIEAAYLAKQNGREGLYYRGIPVVDVQLNGYKEAISDLPDSFAILTDRRNLALAVNTSDMPGTEVRMWYNPDLMENRQRAIFMAGCDYLLPELVTFAVGAPIARVKATLEDDMVMVEGYCPTDMAWVQEILVYAYDSTGEPVVEGESLPIEMGEFVHEVEVGGATSVRLAIKSEGDAIFFLD